MIAVSSARPDAWCPDREQAKYGDLDTSSFGLGLEINPGVFIRIAITH
ncbi:MAG: hypothetical protein HQK61_01635 [Desulfamplus sp.]|nr:hypothetical protein [Desulfamplus sp.]